MLNPKEQQRIYRHKRLRHKVVGTSDRPRLYVHCGLRSMQAHVVDDVLRKVICGMSTLDKSLKTKVKHGGNVQAATLLGEALAAKAKGKGIQKVCFDRGGYFYHGRVKAFADAARKGGLEF